jgi:hypothetical protein
MPPGWHDFTLCPEPGFLFIPGNIIGEFYGYLVGMTKPLCENTEKMFRNIRIFLDYLREFVPGKAFHC